jgi:hypothetical protein
LKFKHRLFGNIKFVGELNRRNLLQENIIISVFDMLLAVESQEYLVFVNDDTVEGSCVLMNKVGYLIDDKIKKVEQAKETGEGKLKKTDKNVSRFRMVFKRFEELATDNAIS